MSLTGAHERDHQLDHAVVLLHVRAVRVERPVRVKGDDIDVRDIHRDGGFTRHTVGWGDQQLGTVSSMD